MAFTTWTAERLRVLNEISGLKITLSSVSIKGRTKVYRQLKDLQVYLDYVESKIAKESRVRNRVRVADVSGT